MDRLGALRFTRLRVAWTTRPAQRMGSSLDQHEGPEAREEDEGAEAEERRMLEARVDRGVPARMAGSTKIGSASRPPMPSSEKAVSPPTAVAVSLPEAASMRNWVAAPKAAPPGTMRLMAFPASCDVATEYQALVRSAMRWRAIVQVKWRHLEDQRRRGTRSGRASSAWATS